MMRGLHDATNERLELAVTSDLGEFRPELARFLRELRLGHLLEEVFLPLLATSRTRVAVAYDERPWPPSGVGARSLRAVNVAVLSDDGQALLTPGFLSPGDVTNLGLAATMTKTLLEDLREQGVEWVSYFVNRRSRLVADTLAGAGFEPRGARILADDTEFVAYTATPSAVLDALAIADRRSGDLLALAVEHPQRITLAAYHLALSAAIANHWAGRSALSEIYPGLIDWVALPPGGITGTPGPGGEEEVPIIVVEQ